MSARFCDPEGEPLQCRMLAGHGVGRGEWQSSVQERNDSCRDGKSLHSAAATFACSRPSPSQRTARHVREHAVYTGRRRRLPPARSGPVRLLLSTRGSRVHGLARLLREEQHLWHATAESLQAHARRQSVPPPSASPPLRLCDAHAARDAPATASNRPAGGSRRPHRACAPLNLSCTACSSGPVTGSPGCDERGRARAARPFVARREPPPRRCAAGRPGSGRLGLVCVASLGVADSARQGPHLFTTSASLSHAPRLWLCAPPACRARVPHAPRTVDGLTVYAGKLCAYHKQQITHKRLSHVMTSPRRSRPEFREFRARSEVVDGGAPGARWGKRSSCVLPSLPRGHGTSTAVTSIPAPTTWSLAGRYLPLAQARGGLWQRRASRRGSMPTACDDRTKQPGRRKR
jgi:hypothetical protein